MITSAPARMYSSWTRCTTPGWSRLARALQATSSMGTPSACSWVPVPPSTITSSPSAIRSKTASATPIPAPPLFRPITPGPNIADGRLGPESTPAGGVHDHSHAGQTDQSANHVEAVGAVSVGDPSPDQRAGHEDPTVGGQDPSEVAGRLKGSDQAVEAQGDHARADPYPAAMLAQALPDQPA